MTGNVSAPTHLSKTRKREICLRHAFASHISSQREEWAKSMRPKIRNLSER